MLVQDFLENTAQRLPKKVALVCAEQRLTYMEVDVMANSLANCMIAHGVRRGDRVAIFLQNSIATVVSIFAALKAGGSFVVINPTTKADKLAYILNDCQATAFITDARNLVLAQKMVDSTSSLKFCVISGPQEKNNHSKQINSSRKVPFYGFIDVQATYTASRPPRQNIDLDLACLIYTSGSTGEPKGVMSDHSNVVFASGSIIEYLQNDESDIVLNTLPLSFDYGLYQLLMTFRFGGTLILEKSFTYPAAVLNQMEKEGVTGFPGVPTIFAILLQMDLSQYNLSKLRYITNTAAALPPSHIQNLREKFPQATIYSMYGLTETKRTLYLPPTQLDNRPGSVGIAIPGTEVWIEDEDGNRLGPEEVGELVIRGRHVMRGYWNAPELSEQRFRPGLLPGERLCYSGDLFRMDTQGYMYFVSRKDDIIKSRGEKVSPKEVENILYSLPGVVEAAVIGVPDPVLGQAIKAFLVTDDQVLTDTKVIAFCRANLEDYMVPKYVQFCDQLPKTSSGKIHKKGLA